MGIAEKIFEIRSFQEEYKKVLIASVKKSLPNLISENSDTICHDWNYLLKCASIIAQSESAKCLDASLRIAQHCLTLEDIPLNNKLAAAVILDSLTNRPALKLALKRNLLSENFLENIPVPLIHDFFERSIKYSIIDNNSEIRYLNKFQKDVYDASREYEQISISAPTSAGKSFILLQIIIDLLTSGPKINIVYIVPTRALISQVETDLRDLVLKYNLTNIEISSIPQETETSKELSSNVFVFTQERLHWFRNSNPNFIIHVLIVDEAQKISEGYRGILLQEKIEEIIKHFPLVKIFYSSPFTSNPEILLDLAKYKISRKPINKDYVSVNKNLVFITPTENNSMLWDLLLCTNEITKLGSISLKFRPTSESKRLIFITHQLANKFGGNLIYANGAAEAEKYALQMFDLVKDDDDDEITDSLKNLIALVKKIIHPQYRLVETLTRRIGFHYGNMPILVRQEIENLFSKGDIRYLFCTSTLMEGVNLPTRSIFIRRPTKGKNKPLNASDFWNLAGRAGRLGKEFEGNVYCIEPDKWEIKPNLSSSKQTITKAIEQLTKTPNEKASLIDFIRNDTPRDIANLKPNLEYAFTYYYQNFLQDTLDNKISYDLETLSILKVEFARIQEKLSLPKDIILRNPGISPIAQQNLFEYFLKKEKAPTKLIPALPESEDAAKLSYLPIVGRISNHLSGHFSGLNYYYAILVVNWMNGYTLSTLISKSFEYWKNRNKPKKIDIVIRDTMRDIEEFVRFKFAKYSSCYVDILRYYLQYTNRSDLLSNIPQLNIWLEFGVSQKTQISLINIGLTRNTAISLSEFIANDNLTKEECINWIMENNVEILEMPLLMIQEVHRIKLLNQKISEVG